MSMTTQSDNIAFVYVCLSTLIGKEKTYVEGR